MTKQQEYVSYVTMKKEVLLGAKAVWLIHSPLHDAEGIFQKWTLYNRYLEKIQYVYG